MKKLHAFVAGLVLALSAQAATFNQFGPSTGVLKGSATSPQTSAATSSDIRAMWSGVCSSSTYLRGDGTCAAAVPATAALTKTDDTNVTATLGGSPSTALLNAASITLGWTGNLAVSRGGTGAGTLTGPLKGNGTSAFTAATAADMYALWSGTCNSSTFLRGDGSCQTAGTSWATTALETAASVTPTALNYPPNDPRRAPAFYASAGYTDFGATPAYVDATHYTYPGDWTGIFKSGMRVRIVGASTNGAALISTATYSAPNTTLTIANDTGDTLTSTPLAIWLQTSLPANDWGNMFFSRNAIGGMSIFNDNQGSLAAARYCAWTRNASHVSDSAVCMVAVSPNYSGAYLGSGFTSGGRAVLYTPPSYHMEIGTSDVARIKIDSGGLITLVQPTTTGSPSLTVNAATSTFEMARFVGSGVSNQFLSLRNGSGVGAFLSMAGNGTTFTTDDFVIGQNGSDSRALIINRANTDMALQVNSTTALTIDNDTGIYTTTATGSSQGAGTINATGLYINGVPVSGGATTTGSFTGTMTGYAVSPTCTVKYRITGNIVYLYTTTAGCQGTSNANTLTMTGLAVAVRPARAVSCLSVSVQDSGTVVLASGDIAAAGSTITFARSSNGGTNTAVTFGTSIWATSGTKGLGSNWSCQYDLDS